MWYISSGNCWIISTSVIYVPIFIKHVLNITCFVHRYPQHPSIKERLSADKSLLCLWWKGSFRKFNRIMYIINVISGSIHKDWPERNTDLNIGWGQWINYKYKTAGNNNINKYGWAHRFSDIIISITIPDYSTWLANIMACVYLSRFFSSF